LPAEIQTEHMKHLLQIFFFNSAMCLALQLSAADSPAPSTQAPTPKRGYEIEKLKVLKVYSATNGTEVFRSYAVKWKDQEVVVSDVLAETSHEVGDTITVEIIHLPVPRPNSGTLSFVINEPRGPAGSNTQHRANGSLPSGSQANRMPASTPPRRSP